MGEPRYDRPGACLGCGASVAPAGAVRHRRGCTYSRPPQTPESAVQHVIDLVTRQEIAEQDREARALRGNGWPGEPDAVGGAIRFRNRRAWP